MRSLYRKFNSKTYTTMENIAITTRKPNVLDRISGWFWRMRFEREAKRRSERNKARVEAYIKSQREL